MTSAYEQMADAILARVCSFPNERPGQATFNAVSVVRPDIANALRSTSLDPFYDDDKIVPFLTYVYRMLEDEASSD